MNYEHLKKVKLYQKMKAHDNENMVMKAVFYF